MIKTGFFDFLKKKKPDMQGYKYAYTQTGVMPRHSNTYGDNVFDCDTVQQAVGAIAREMKKLEPHHVREKGRDKKVVDDQINKLLLNPNPNMTISDFIEKCLWLYYLKWNCYVYPAYEIATDENGRLYKDYKGVFPLNPTEVTYYEDNDGNILKVLFEFSGGKQLFVDYADIIHLRYSYSLNDYDGGNKYGKPNNDALLTTIRINHKLLDGVSSGVEASQLINGIVKYNTLLDEEKVAPAIADFNDMLANSQSGIIGMDMKSDYVPFSRDVKMVDKDTLEFLDKKILRNYGVPASILDGTATAEIKRAFYETTLEPLIVMLNQAFTKVLFTQQQVNGGNKVVFYYNRLETMTNAEKLEHAHFLGDRGAMSNNEARELFGYPPIDGGDVYKCSLNYVDTEIANQYQLGNVGTKASATPQESTEGTEAVALSAKKSEQLDEDVEQVVVQE